MRRRRYPWEGIIVSDTSAAKHRGKDDESVSDRQVIRGDDGKMYVETRYHDGRPAERETYTEPEPE